MLTRAEIEDYLSRITYKPDWWFQIRSDREGVFIFITARVPNAYRPEEMIDLGIKSYLPPFETLIAFRSWVEWRLERIENHELREWFKVDGAAVSDPHK